MDPIKSISLIYFSGISIALIIFGKAGFLAYFYAITPIMIPLYFWMQHQASMKKIGQRLNHKIVVAVPPGEYDFSLGRLDEHCIFVPVGRVTKTVFKERRLLEKAGNQTGADIFAIYWKDGEHYCEDLDQYKSRCEHEIIKLLTDRHIEIQRAKDRWYEKNHHKEQRIFDWEKE